VVSGYFLEIVWTALLGQYSLDYTPTQFELFGGSWKEMREILMISRIIAGSFFMRPSTFFALGIFQKVPGVSISLLNFSSRWRFFQELTGLLIEVLTGHFKPNIYKKLSVTPLNQSAPQQPNKNNFHSFLLPRFQTK
jgi:hypothetical protein